MKRISGSTLLLVAAALAVGVGAPDVQAHAAYKDSSPAHRSTVSSPPEQVWAEFTEPVQSEARLDIFDPCGARVDRGDPTVTGYRVTVAMSGETAGTYRVAFHVVSSLDGHATQGEFVFTSSGGAPCDGDAGGASRPGERSSGEAAPPPAPRSARSAPRPASEDAPASEERAGGSRGKKRGPEEGGSKSRSGRGRRDRREVPARAALAQEDLEGPPAGDIPLDWLLVGFGLSALIGAVAGQIYASILGPPRRRRR